MKLNKYILYFGIIIILFIPFTLHAGDISYTHGSTYNKITVDTIRGDSTNGLAIDSDRDGTNEVVINTAGNIGLSGEISPESSQEITSTTPYITLHNSTHENTDGGMESKIRFKGETGAGAEWHLGTIQVNHDGTSADGKGDIIFSNNDGNDADDTLQERMRIDSSGNVGIGTTAPAAPLHINGTEAKIRIQSAGSDLAGIEFYDGENHKGGIGWYNSDGIFKIIGGSSFSANHISITNTGNVGIGTTSPSTKLHILSATAGTNTLQPVATHECTTTGVPLAGFGPKINFKAETDPNSTGNSKILVFIGAPIEDPTTDSEDGAFVIGTMTAGAAATEKWRVSSDGTIKIIANNGSSINEGYLTEEVTIPVGSGADPVVESTSNLAPASSLILGCVFYVTDAPGGGAATIDIGITGSGDLDDLIDGASCDILGESGDNFTNGDADHLGIVRNTAAATLTLTTDADVTGDSMKVRIVIFYRDLNVPTS